MARSENQTENVAPDALEQSLGDLARSVFGFATQLGVPEDMSADRDSQLAKISMIVSSHPQTHRLVEEFANHPELNRFAPNAAGSNQMLSSFGRGGAVRLDALPASLLIAAWFRGHARQDEFVSNSVALLRVVRDALSGIETVLVARLSLCGVLIPPSKVYDFGDVRLRAKLAHEYQQVPEHLAGNVGNPNNVVVSRGGDVVAEVNVTYRVDVATPAGWNGAPPIAYDELDEESLRLRASLILALRTADRLHLLAKRAGSELDDPLFGPSGSWSFADAMIGIVPTQLSEADIELWRRWYLHLASPEGQKIALAISRLLRAVSDARDVSDLLIDSVVAWENLFGGPEMSFRVTGALAVLLEPDRSRRRAFRKELATIYSLRSKIVHGGGTVSPADTALCFQALDIAMRAVRALFEERKALLQLDNSTARSAALLLDESDGP